jgi:hypothetical protein
MLGIVFTPMRALPSIYDISGDTYTQRKSKEKAAVLGTPRLDVAEL